MSVEESERLKKLQKQLFRRIKGSNNRYKTIKKIQRQYQKMTNKKQDKVNQLVSKFKKYNVVVMQDEQIASWHSQKCMSRTVQHSCMGMLKSRLKQLDNVIILDKYIPTTKWCPVCHRKHTVSLSDRTFKCECGYQEDRDVHAAKNMLAIKNLVEKHLEVDSRKRIVPVERREITLVEFKTSVGSVCDRTNKSEC